MPRKLSIDIETYSAYDLKKVGVYKYVESLEFAILLFAYAFDDGDVQVVDLLSGETLPDAVTDAMLYDNVELHAHNAAFERVCINRHFGFDIPPEQWRCTMVHGLMLGLPGTLAQVAKELKLEEQKDTEGKKLIDHFCKPCKPTKANGQRERNLPEHDRDKWARFKEYNAQDVIVERSISKKIAFYEVSAEEREVWRLDQIMNDRGILLDLPLIRNAISIGTRHKALLRDEAIALTGLANPNSGKQLISWLEAETGDTVRSLTKESVVAMLGTVSSDTVERVLRIRQEGNKTSTAKYAKMLGGVCADGRYRGLIQLYGANRTGRDAGRGWQPQNLPKIRLHDIDQPRQLVAACDTDMLEALYDGVPSTGDKIESNYANIPDVLSQLVRTSLIAAPGHRYIVSDFKAIEARVIAWLAGEQWALDAFATHGKIYEAAASRMYSVPLEQVTKDSPYREKGKIGTLLLGFGGGVDALIKMGGSAMALPDNELQDIVNAWRKANPNIVQYWYEVERAACNAVLQNTTTTVRPGIEFATKNSVLFIKLPSGRKLSYLCPSVKREIKVFVKFTKANGKYKEGKKALLPIAKANEFNSAGVCEITSSPAEKLSLSYEGMDQEKRIWRKIDTYGGKLVENIVQATARDCLMHAFVKTSAKGYQTVLRVHDELVIEAPVGFGSVKEVEEIMSEPIPWAPGLPLAADGFESEYYKK